MDEYTIGIDGYVRQSLIARLAPVVERLARLETDEADREGLRPTTRKVIAFDARASAWGMMASMVFFLMAGNMLIGLGRLMTGNARGAAQLAVAAALALVAACAGLWGMAARLRRLNRLFERCVAVTGRVIGKAPGAWWESPAVVLTIEYPLAGTLRHAQVHFTKGKDQLVRPVPDLLVDADGRSRVFIRDFYV